MAIGRGARRWRSRDASRGAWKLGGIDIGVGIGIVCGAALCAAEVRVT